jgi:hypothetical protein
MISTVLFSLQQAALGALKADAFYDGTLSANKQPIPIVTESHGSIVQDIELALAKVGICALLITPTIDFHAPNTQDASGFAKLNVALYEDAPINQGNGGTGIQIAQLAEATVMILHWYQHGCYTAGVAQEPTAATRFLALTSPIEFQSPGPPLQYNVAFQAHVTLNPQYS